MHLQLVLHLALLLHLVVIQMIRSPSLLWQGSTSLNRNVLLFLILSSVVFKLVSIAPVCIQQNIFMERNQRLHTSLKNQQPTILILKRSTRSIYQLHKVTGDPLEDLKQTFDGNVGLFEDNVSFKLAPDVNQFSYHHVLYHKA